jgi:hypothetical protein
VGQPGLCRRRLELPADNFKIIPASAPPNFSARLRRIVFVGKAALRWRFDIDRVGLRPVKPLGAVATMRLRFETQCNS